MQKVKIADITLREAVKTSVLSFKEKIEITKKLDKLNVDIIETEIIQNERTDVLFLHTISPLVKNSIISCAVDYNERSIELTYDAVKEAANKRLHLMVPVSTVQMEYMCHKKPNAVIEMIETLVKKCKSLCNDVEFSALDATRSEKDFLYKAINTAIDAGATTITVCDSAGEMLPDEFKTFTDNLYKNVKSLKDVTLSVECRDALNMATACMISTMNAGVTQIKTNVNGCGYPSLSAAAGIIKQRGDSIGVYSSINYTELEHTVAQMVFVTDTQKSVNSPFETGVREGEKIVLSKDDTFETVAAVVKKMGYDLSEEDVAQVYDEFKKVADKKHIGSKELDAIIASAAMQVAPTYKLVSYVINSGNIISATANITLEKDGKSICGVCVGDGPVDAAFLAIEQIAGRHFELDDFQIQAITEGREAVGSTVVKLRSNGKLYSGKGISTDVIGASINAYINALNKICFEEA